MRRRAMAMAALAASWGTIPLIVRGVDLAAEQLAAARLWLGALSVLGVLAIRGELRIRRGDPIRRVVLLGILLAVHWAAFFWSIKTTTVAVALVLVYLAPIAMATLAGPVLGEPLHPRSIIALITALAGVVLVARPGAGVTVEGVVAGLIAAVTFAALVLIGKPASQRLGGLKLAGMQMTVAALALTPWAIQAAPRLGEFWWQLGILGVALTGFGLFVYWALVSTLPVATVAILSYMEPASAVVWAAIFLGERGDVLTWLGVALVLLAGLGSTARQPVPTVG